MKARNILILILGTLILPIYLTSCGVDRWKEYAGQTQTDRWIDDTMRVWYYWVDAIPHTNDLNYFQAPFTFFASLKSEEDKFSTIDSLVSVTTTRSIPYTDYSYGFQFTTNQIEVEGEENAIVAQILYVADGSPASEIGLKRGDWIIAVDNQKVSTSDYSTYITRPTKAYSFTLGKYNPYPEDVDDPEFNYIEFDTLGVVQMPEPRYVEEQDVLKYGIISAGTRKAFYLLYNEFGESTDALKEVFSQLNGQQFDDIILDLRYNPGGYVNTSHQLCSALAPATAIGQPFLNMIYNDKINKTETLNFESSSLTGGTSISYQNLYVLTSGNTASASEIVINCLKPYMEGRLYQVGTATYGKNVAQQLFTNAEAPGIELWLTTTYLSNSQGYYDYFTNGLLPDYEIEENYGGELGDFGSAEDQLLQPVLYKMANGSFPVITNPDESEDATTLSRSRTSKHVQLLVDPIAQKPHYNRIKK